MASYQRYEKLFDDYFRGSGDDSSDGESSIGDSVDVLSDSSASEGENDNNGFFDDSNDESDRESDDGNDSVEGSVIDGEIGHGVDANILHLHDPPVFLTLHCPPFATIEPTLHGECDYNDFGMDLCGRTDNFEFFSALKLADEYEISVNSVRSLERLPSNILRKRLYKLPFHATDFGLLERNANYRTVLWLELGRFVPHQQGPTWVLGKIKNISAWNYFCVYPALANLKCPLHSLHIESPISLISHSEL
jgi:hypothetical protein